MTRNIYAELNIIVDIAINLANAPTPCPIGFTDALKMASNMVNNEVSWNVLEEHYLFRVKDTLEYQRIPEERWGYHIANPHLFFSIDLRTGYYGLNQKISYCRKEESHFETIVKWPVGGNGDLVYSHIEVFEIKMEQEDKDGPVIYHVEKIKERIRPFHSLDYSCMDVSDFIISNENENEDEDED